MIDNVYVKSYGINLSKHEFVVLELKKLQIQHSSSQATLYSNELKKVAWQKCTENDVELYKSYLDNALSEITEPIRYLNVKMCSAQVKYTPP